MMLRSRQAMVGVGDSVPWTCGCCTNLVCCAFLWNDYWRFQCDQGEGMSSFDCRMTNCMFKFHIVDDCSLCIIILSDVNGVLH
jgi:hypothetical protein